MIFDGLPADGNKEPPSNEIRTSAVKVNFRCSVRRSRHCVPHQPAARSGAGRRLTKCYRLSLASSVGVGLTTLRLVGYSG